jgi:hypothetical protein
MSTGSQQAERVSAAPEGLSVDDVPRALGRYILLKKMARGITVAASTSHSGSMAALAVSENKSATANAVHTARRWKKWRDIPGRPCLAEVAWSSNHEVNLAYVVLHR